MHPVVAHLCAAHAIERDMRIEVQHLDASLSAKLRHHCVRCINARRCLSLGDVRHQGEDRGSARIEDLQHAAEIAFDVPDWSGGAEKIVQTSVDDEEPRAISLRTLQLPGDIREPRAPLGEVYHRKGATLQRAKWAAGRETIADDGDAGDGGS